MIPDKNLSLSTDQQLLINNFQQYFSYIVTVSFIGGGNYL